MQQVNKSFPYEDTGSGEPQVLFQITISLVIYSISVIMVRWCSQMTCISMNFNN
jgi:hypothetical protein